MACSTYVGIYRDYGPQVLVTDPFVDQVVVPVCVKECFCFQTEIETHTKSIHSINIVKICVYLRIMQYHRPVHIMSM